MTIIDNEHIYTYDVDDTLVMWHPNVGDTTVDVVNPYDGVTQTLRPHAGHIALLKQMHGRGRFIVVWSQGGVQWARAVVEALGLTSYVGLVMTKPSGYIDDLAVSAWFHNHIYLKEGRSNDTTD